MCTLLACFIGTVNLQFWAGYLATIFETDYGLSETIFGFIVTSQTLLYVIGCLLMPYMCEHLPRKLLFMIAMLGFAVCMILLGPSELFGLPHQIITMVVAFPLLGIFQVFVFIPIIPEIFERLTVEL